ncbi:MAG TPA: succinate dehydrogenase cytochrome b subunit [Longimicrobiales bacterium]|nr:succinate dehydrogenase cytochrome b subunit [Longimicrobiales bacterium]
MRRVLTLWDATVGRKIVMASTGVILILFVIGHMVGNLKVYMGPEAFNHYAEGLRTFGAPFFGDMQLLWLIRAFLLVTVVLHIWAAISLSLQSRRARPIGYRKYQANELVFSYASRTMLWGGLVLIAFIVYHLMHFTIGNAHPRFVPGDAYHNFVVGFQQWPVSLAYIAAMIPLALHLYHGLWSMLQTLGANNAKYNHLRRPIALGIALVVALANISFPVAVLAGVLTLR